MEFALIKNNEVINIIVSDTVPEIPGMDYVIRTDNLDGQKPGTGWGYDGDVFTTPPPPAKLKSIYKKEQFIAMLPKSKIRAIQTAMGTNDDINVWVFNLPFLDKIDLNNLPNWFTEGVAGMVTESIITQGQADAFLENS